MDADSRVTKLGRFVDSDTLIWMDLRNRAVSIETRVKSGFVDVVFVADSSGAEFMLSMDNELFESAIQRLSNTRIKENAE